MTTAPNRLPSVLRILSRALAALAVQSCGEIPLHPHVPTPPAEAVQTAQANLLLHPMNDPEALLGRAVHLTGHNAWTIADDRAPGCEVAVKRQPSNFRTHRSVDLHSLTAIAAGLPSLIGIEVKYGRSVTANIDINNTEVVEADVSPRCGDVVVDKVFVGSGKVQIVVQAEAGPAPGSVSHEGGDRIADETEWREPQAYGFGTRKLGDTPPLDLTVRLPGSANDGSDVSATIETSRKAWLVVFYQEGDGKASVLWPSAEEPEPTSEPGRAASLPSSRERAAGITINAQLRDKTKEAHDLLVVYAFTDKADYDRYKPVAGADAEDGPKYVSELTRRVSDLPMARWSRAISAYTIRPARR